MVGLADADEVLWTELIGDGEGLVGFNIIAQKVHKYRQTVLATFAGEQGNQGVGEFWLSLLTAAQGGLDGRETSSLALPQGA